MAANLTFVHISDLHILGTPGERAHGADTEAILRQAVPRINALRPDFVVATGDLSGDGSPASYRRLGELLRPLAAPLYACPGNHDARDLLRQLQPGLPATGRLHQAFEAGGHRFLLLDSAEPGKEAGRLGDEELAWLEAELRGQPQAPTWLFLHHQPMPVHVRWIDRIGLLDGDALLDLLTRHPQVRGVGYGHVHLPRRWRYGAALFVSVPALAFQVSPLSQEPEVTLDPPGFRLVAIGNGEVRDWLHYLDGHVVPGPRLSATPVYVR
jgi:Icc protein